MFGSNDRSSRLRSKLTLERLESRDVPSVVDLTTAGSSGIVNGAIFQQCAPQPNGGTAVRSIVQMQVGGNASIEQGYNTDARPVQFDENKNSKATTSQLFDTVPVVSIGGVNYRQFLLDINQKGSAALLSLDELRVYVAGAPNLTGYNASTGQLAGHAALYDLDAGGDNWVKLNDSLNTGSGTGDMFLLVPDLAFAGMPAGSYVYLYSKFGVHYGANSGAEEWAVKGNGQSVPPPPTPMATVSGTVFDDKNQNGLLDTTEVGLGGATVQITGKDLLGNTVTMSMTTDDSGHYSFTVPAGTYSITEISFPLGYFGSPDNNYTNVVVTAGSNNTYNFADLFAGS
jgi:hypothetical protein